MADENKNKYSHIKSEIKGNRAHSDTVKRASEKSSKASSHSHHPQKGTQASRTQKDVPQKHSYSNYDRETEITVEIPKTLLTELEKQKKAQAEQSRQAASPSRSASRYPSPSRTARPDSSGQGGEREVQPPKKKKKAARSVADLKASSEKGNVISRVTVAVNSTQEKRRLERVREKMYLRRKKNEQRKKKALYRRKSTVLGRFFLDEGERYTKKSVEGAQKITKTEQMANSLAEVLYSNRAAQKTKKMLAFLRLCEARAYGVALIIFGLFSLLAYFASAHLPMIPYKTGTATLVCAILCVGFSLPLLLSRQSMQTFFEKSLIVGNIFFDFFGMRRSGDTAVQPSRARFGILLGVALGVLGFFVSPITILAILFIVTFCSFVMSTPEFGLYVLIFILPFMSVFGHPSILLCALIILCYISYLRKLLIGKRSFRFRPCDLFVMLFGVFYLGGGIFSFASGTDSYKSALAYFCIISVYFLAVNLMTNKRVVDNAMRALVMSGFIVSVLGIIQGGAGYVTSDWLDTSAYQYISGRITTAFNNPNVLASYLIIVIPFALVYTFERSRNATNNIFNALTLVCLAAALVFTWSRGAWVGIAIGLLMLCTFVFRRSPKLIVAIFAWIPNLLLFAPQSVWQRIASIFSFLGNDVDSSINYRFTVWRDSLRLFADNIFGGIGVGSASFSEAYIEYASIGAENALHSHNLFLQIGIEVGVFALILFVLVLIYTYRNCYSMEFVANQSRVRGVCLASFCSLTALLVNGMADYVWYNYRICFLFFLVLGICNATYRIATEEQRYTDYVAARVSSFASLDVPYKK